LLNKTVVTWFVLSTLLVMMSPLAHAQAQEPIGQTGQDLTFADLGYSHRTLSATGEEETYDLYLPGSLVLRGEGHYLELVLGHVPAVPDWLSILSVALNDTPLAVISLTQANAEPTSLHFDLAASALGRYQRDQEIAEAIAAQLAKVDVRVIVYPQDWSTYVHKRLIPRETVPLFLLSLVSRGNDLEDTQNLAYGFPFNPTLWYNEEFEQLLGEAEQTFNRTVRLNLLRQAQAVAYEEAPWIWLWRPFLFDGVGKDLARWQPRADGLIYLYTPAPEVTTERSTESQ